MEYRHLTLEDRTVIMICAQKGLRVEAAARAVGRSAATIRRELARNPSPYDALAAQTRAANVTRWRRRRKLDDARLRAEVDRRLREDHSPWQVARRLKRDFGHSAMWASHWTIYRFVHEQLRQGVRYGPHLRKGDPRWRRPSGKPSPRRRILDGKSIAQRPAAANDRTEAGHIESDTLRGAFRSSWGLATHVDRKTRYVVLALLPDRSSATYIRETRRAFARHPGLVPKTFTVDNGMEFSRHRQMERDLKAAVYFARPYHPWERGLNENTNGLLRQYFPKGCNLARFTEADIRRIEELLNNRPRRCLGYRTPAEALHAECSRT